jgi:hypothetical protein
VQALADKVRAQYKFVLGIRGDDTPEHAEYLGYLAAEGFYPVFKPVSFETFGGNVAGQTAQPLRRCHPLIGAYCIQPVYCYNDKEDEIE